MKINNDKVNKAIDIWLSLSQEEIIVYQSRLKYILDEAAKLEDAKYMAEQKGKIERKLEEKEETATKLLANGMDIDFISKITSLPTERIEQIKKGLYKIKIINNDKINKARHVSKISHVQKDKCLRRGNRE